MVFVSLIIFKILQTKKFADIIIPRGAENFGMFIILHIFMLLNKTIILCSQWFNFFFF